MKVFISWSGDQSRKLAEALRKWLPSALHVVKPYFTPDDIEKGARWENEIPKELEKCEFGIICVTPDNVEKPWIMFEAGALAKKFESSRVCPLLLGLDETGARNPLTQFQATKFTKDDFKKLFKTINSLCAQHKLEAEVLDEVFEMWWPKIEGPAKEILEEVQEKTPRQPPSEKDMLDEILELLRLNVRLTRRYEGRPVARRWRYSGPYIRLSKALLSLAQRCGEMGYDDLIPLVGDAARNAEQIVTASGQKFPNTLSRLRAVQEACQSEPEPLEEQTT